MEIKSKFLRAITSSSLYPFYFAAGILLIIYYPVFFQGKLAVNDSDALELHIPNNYFVAQSYKQGKIPFWNPYFNLGQPVSDGTTPLFHPGLIFYLFMDSFLANTVEILVGLFLSCLGIWYFLSSLGFSSFSVFLGSLIYILIGPVFFQHSYHLGFMAVLVLPWTLYLFHRYDDTKKFRWLISGVILCVLAVHSLDQDLLIYVFLGIFIDRAISISRNRIKCLTLWAVIFFLSLLTGLVSFLPFHQWLRYSSRLLHSYDGILTPGMINLLFACFANNWFTYYPYSDVFYFYIGLLVVWLVLISLSEFNKKEEYVYRFSLYSIIFPVYYIIIRLMQFYTDSIFDTIDPWKCMVVFCFGLTLLSVKGIDIVIQSKKSFWKQSIVIGLLALMLALICFLKKLEVWIFLNLIIVGSSIFLFSIIKSKKLRGIVLLFTTIVNMAVPAVNYAVIRRACTGEVSKERVIKSIPFFRYFKNIIKDSHCRVSIFQGNNNSTSIARLRSIPNYSPFYNLALERSLVSDKLILSNNAQPYWMLLNRADAKKLSYYGVRYLIVEPTGVRPAWQREEFVTFSQGWKKVHLPPEWAEFKVWENIYYIGRAYVVSEQVEDRGEVQFLKDEPEKIILKVKVKEPRRLVLADLYYPGWEVLVDNKPFKIEKYKGCLRSVQLEEGEHLIEFRYNEYRPKIYLLISGISLCVLFVFLSFVKTALQK